MRASIAWAVLVFALPACTVRTTPPGGAGPPPPRAYVPPASIRVDGARVVADVWLSDTGDVRALLFGPGVVSPSREMTCRSTREASACPSLTFGDARQPARHEVRRDAAWELDLAAVSTGPYRIDIARGTTVLARAEFSLVAVPSIGGETAWIVDPVGRARVAYATRDGWVAWLPIDGRFAGEHTVTVAWYHDGRRVREAEARFSSAFATRDARTGELGAGPVFEVRPFFLGRMPEVAAHVGTYTAIVVFDHAVVAGAWSVQVAAGPLVERGQVGMLYDVVAVETFTPAFGDPGAFWAELPAITPAPALVADAISIRPAIEPAPTPLPAPLVCAIASEPSARQLLADTTPERAGRGPRVAPDPLARFRPLARRHSDTCLEELVGPAIAPSLL